MTLRIGSLNSRVTLEQLSTTQDAVGQPLATWSTVAMLWANIIHNTGVESIKANADMSVARASIRIRYKTGITAGMRVSYNGAHYNIRAILMDAVNKEFTDLVCELVI